MKRLVEITRGVVALLVVVAIVVAAPFVLIKVGRLDALSLLWSDGLVGYGTDVMLGVVTLVAWVAWLLATLSIFSELIGSLTGHRLRMPGAGIFGPASAVLVTAILGLVASGTAVSDTSQLSSGESSSIPVVAKVASESDQAVAATKQVDDVKVHIVQPGEDLWTLAERYFGDGMRWRELAELNDTTLLKPTAPLQAGSQLFVPVDQAGSDVLGTSAQGSAMRKLPTEQGARTGLADFRSVEVEPGDSLWGIAERELGDGAAWPQIAQANQELIDDPNLIDIGWRLRVPTESAVTLSTAEESSVTTAQVEAVPQASSSNIPTNEPVEQPNTSQEQLPAETQPTSNAEFDVQAEESRDAEELYVDGPNVASILAGVGSVAGISVALAATIAAALRLRRGRQLAQLPVGHRLSYAADHSAEVGSALLALADHDTDWASDEAARSVFATDPLRVRLGEADDQPIWFDLREAALTVLAGGSDETLGLATSVILQLIAEEVPVRVVAAGGGFAWLTALDEPRLTNVSNREAHQQLLHLLTERSDAHLSSDGLSHLQQDPETAEAWATTIFVFADDLQLDALDVAELRKLGIAVLVCAPGTNDEPDSAEPAVSASGGFSAPMTVKVGELAARLPNGTEFIPDHVSAPARRALSDLFEAANEVEFEPAEWWSDQPLDTANVIPLNHSSVPAATPWMGVAASQRLEPQLPISSQAASPIVSEQVSAHPFLKLLGPVELVGARGETPSRAVKQCAEYCAWLMEHPGASAPQMTRSLLVAETTRRSNMSRLRSWLGADEQGAPYLPEAYSGRIHLHPAISSDWEQFGLLLSAGVNRAGDEALRHALGMVRGAPLADAAPGQWHWAEQLRADMAAMIRDAAYVLATRELAANQYDAARWAANRGLLASPEDEQLLGVKLLIEHRCGNRLEVDRLVLHITRQARILGVDLMDETVTLLQEVVEGQARSRMA